MNRNREKWMKHGLGTLINLGVGLAFGYILMLLFNAIGNAIPYLIRWLAQSLSHHKITPATWINASLFLRHPEKISELFIFGVAFAVTALFAMRTVLRISQWIQSLIPYFRSTAEGAQRWATKREIKKSLVQIKKKGIEEAPVAGLLLASDRRHYYVEGEVVHSLCVGITGSGKDQLLVLPSIRLISQCANPENIVAFDLKGDMLKNSYQLLKKKGYRIYVLNFKEPALSHQWNPLTPIIAAYVAVADKEGRDFSKAIELTNELAQIITENLKSDPVWPQSAKSLLVAVILFMLDDGYKKGCLDKLNFYSVYNFFVELGGTEITRGNHTYNALDQLMSSLPIGHPAKMAYATSRFAKGEMRSSIFATLASNLQIFGDSGIAYMTGGNEIDFHAVADPNQPCAIFMVMDENKVTRYLLATLFISQCYSALVEIAEGRPGRLLPRRVHFYMNEFGSTPRIPDMEQKFAAARSMGVVLNLFIQDNPQLEAKYGHHTAATIQGNCGNWIYLNSTDSDTNKYFSSMLGNETLEYTTYNSENGDILNKTRMQHQKSSALMRPEDLWRIPEGEIVVLRQREYPIYTRLPYYYRLGLPVTQIEDIMPQRPIELDKLLYPIDSVSVPGMPNISPEEAQAVDERREAAVRQGAITNMDVLTATAFSQAVSRREFITARQMIRKYRGENNIDDTQVNALEAYLNSLQ